MTDSYTSKDTLILEDYNGEWILSGFADGVVATLTAPNELSTVVTGYNGNCLGAHNEPGRQRSLELRLVKACQDDKRLNANYNLWKNRDDRFKALKGTFVKHIKHTDGSMTTDTVTCHFGLPAQQPVQQIDTTASIEQVVSVYTLNFGDSERSLG